jgi:xanthine dehydrogenase accessory factor
MTAVSAHGEPGHVHDEACAAAHGAPVPHPPSRRLVVVFVSPVAHELAALADRLGWPVTVLDPDRRRLDAEPVPYARTVSSVAHAALHADCDVVVCDHDRPELGDVLAAVLAAPTRWVGVMGSLRHSAPHVAALRERGVPDADVARVHRPIGLDIGSRTPPEIAVATLAGLLADRNGRPGGTFRPREA